jgi:hypothetical protein
LNSIQTLDIGAVDAPIETKNFGLFEDAYLSIVMARLRRATHEFSIQ